METVTLSSITKEQLTPQFREKIRPYLNEHALNKFILNNLPSDSLKLLECLNEIGIKIETIITRTHIFLTIINSSLKLCDKLNEQITLKNKKEQKAQLEIVKILVELKINFNENPSLIMGDALISRNLKIIKYLVSRNIGDIKRNNFYFGSALHNVLQGWNCKYNLDNEQQNSLIKVIKYLVDQGVDIHNRDKGGATVLHLAAKYHSLKIIKYLVSLGIDIHSLDKEENNVLLSAFRWRSSIFRDHGYGRDLEQFVKQTKYFISIGVNIEGNNKYEMNVLAYTIRNGNFDLIKFIVPLMKTLIESSFQKNNSSKYYGIIQTCNLEMIKYLDEFPFFNDYFGGENKIKTKNSILFDITWIYSKHLKENQFLEFKEIFGFFLDKRNNINSIDKKNCIPIYQFYQKEIELSKSRKVLDFLIEKGSNLHHVSDQGSAFHFLLKNLPLKAPHNGQLEMRSNLKFRVKREQDIAKYIMIRSMEINSQIVDHPKFDDLDDEDSFEDFFRKDEEEENEEKVIKWKKGMAEILMKSPKILNLVSPSNPSYKFKFDKKTSQLIKG